MIHVRQILGSSRVRALALAGTLALGSLLPAGRAAVQAAHSRAGNDTLVISWPISPQGFDPPGLPDNPSIWVAVNIFDQLLRPGNDGTSLNPDLATSWDISTDGKVYTFHLRPNVFFHDGTKLTSADVKFSLDRARDPKELWSFLDTEIKRIDTPDPDTVKITLQFPWAPFLSDMAFFGSAIYPAAFFKKVGASGLAAHPMGTGPYVFESFTPGQAVVLKKNHRYWAAAEYPMERVEFDVNANDATRLLQVESGQIDVDNPLAPNLAAQVKASQSASLLISPSTEIKYLQPNNKVPPFGDVKVRQAINHAIDRAALVKQIYYGYASPANSFMAKGAIDWDPNIPVPSHDVTLARKLLGQSSVPHGFSFNMEVGAGRVEDNQVAVLLKNELAPLGITLNIKPMDPTILATNNQNFKFDMIAQYWTNDIPDPDELVSYSVDYSQAVKSYYTQYNNPLLTKLTHQAEQITDPAARQKIYYQVQQIWANEVPFFATVYVPFINAVNNHVHGFGENPLGYFILKGVTKS